MTIYGPAGTRSVLEAAVRMGVERMAFPVQVKTLEDGGRVEFGDWAVHAFTAEHGVTALGYALIEEARLGRFDVDAVRRMGVPEGPLFGRLHRGETVEVDGRSITPEEVVGPPRPGRKVVYTGDTRPTRRTVEIAMGADLLIHEATFSAEEGRRARETRHSTVVEAARVAQRARARRLVLTHISARYADVPKVLRRQAREVFPATEVAHDGMELEIGYRD